MWCEEVKSFSAPGNLIYGIAFDGTYLWITDVYTPTIYKIDQEGKEVATISLSVEGGLSGIDYDRENNCLWVHGLEGKKIYKVNTSGEVLTSFPSPASEYPTGLAFDGEHLWAVDMQAHKIYKINTSGETQTSFTIPIPKPTASGRPRGLAFDPNAPSGNLLVYYTWWSENRSVPQLDSSCLYELTREGEWVKEHSCNFGKENGRIVGVDYRRGEYWVGGGRGRIRKIRGFYRNVGVEETISSQWKRGFTISPNPCWGEVYIHLHLPKKGKVTLKIYDITGREIYSREECVTAGNYRMVWKGEDKLGREITSGVYFCRIKINKKWSKTEKFLLFK